MKQVLIILGSARKKNTFTAANKIAQSLSTIAEVEYIYLHKLDLQFCNGCKLCFDKGEHHCPLDDDRDIILDKMRNADGVIIATPNYAFQVSARVKNLLDRTAFVLHRPEFFGKTFMAVVSQGVMGGGNILKYLESGASNQGFTVAKGACVNTLEPMADKQLVKLEATMTKASKRFIKVLQAKPKQSPSLYRLMMFRMTRSGIKCAKVKLYDYDYFKKKGYFESDYYYDVKLSPAKKMLGRLFDLIGRRIGENS